MTKSPPRFADVDLDPAADDVVEADDALADPEAEGAAATLGLAGGALLGRQVGAATDVARRLLGRLLGLAVGVELLGRAVAGVGLVGGEQALGGRGVERQPLHLAVRRVRAAGRLAGDLGTLVPARARASGARRGCPSRRRSSCGPTSVSSSRRMNVPPMCRANR